MTEPIEGLHNFRDTGGTPLASGGVTRPGVLFRSDALNALTDAGVAALDASPIGTVVDFRTPEERAAAPDRLPTRTIETVELSILEGAMAQLAKEMLSPGSAPTADQLADAAAKIPTLDQLYIGMLQHGADAFATVARLVAGSDAKDDEPSAVLVHCTAGKDRTGVATALLLDAAGAERAAVVADYASSEQNLAGDWADGMLRMVASFGIPLTPALETLVVRTPPEAISAALAWVDATHGSSADYLRSGGLTEHGLETLRTRLAG
ncbi:MAG: tyrosine-protein phosphatase [Microbacterium sp.]|uniref:tyrosine-protein phosphatase n=1 Tax=Microbacterium sp. TaxID=51671 RepID=UPI001ACBEC5C|nr:tyrosine-protein phosphatase [Microbacterium sp.]MBN9178049.1 tyrosine-protein phosphatase [Microbacterium sp.]